jgi:hypothetical protein
VDVWDKLYTDLALALTVALPTMGWTYGLMDVRVMLVIVVTVGYMVMLLLTVL